MPSFMLLSQFAQSTYFFDLTALTSRAVMQQRELKALPKPHLAKKMICGVFLTLVKIQQIKLIPGDLVLGMIVELPELPEFAVDDAVAVFWLTDGLVDSKSSFVNALAFSHNRMCKIFYVARKLQTLIL